MEFVKFKYQGGRRSGIMVVMSKRVAYHQVHGLVASLLDIILKKNRKPNTDCITTKKLTPLSPFYITTISI